MDRSQKVYTVVGATSVVAVSAIVGYVLFATPDKRTATAYTRPVSSQVTTQSPTIAPTPSQAAAYKDGEYTADVSYDVPEGGLNDLNIKMTVSGGKITSITPDSRYDSHESQRYVDRFSHMISGTVVGQPLDSLYVGRVGGASLTSSAFNDALDQIRNQAQSQS